MNYTSYPKSKDTPSRKVRKSMRHSIGQKNRKLKAYLKRDIRRARLAE